MNKLDTQYQALLQDIIDNGIQKGDRTGTGTISVFGRQIRHKMSEGFPLLTTKKMYFKGIVTELLWFLRGDTNIKFLVDNDCHIWDGDTYKKYEKEFEKGNAPGRTLLVQRVDDKTTTRKLSIEDFVLLIKTDNTFAQVWGELGFIYGKQWRSWKKVNESWDERVDPPFKIDKIEFIDQIANLINDLKTNPDSRRLMVNAWNVGELDQMTLPPCHYGFQVYTRELSFEERWGLAKKYGYIKGDIDMPTEDSMYMGLSETNTLNSMWNDSVANTNLPTRAISLMWNQRSVDTFLGLPFNIASYGLLLEIIAKAVNMVPDELIGNLGDTHLYSNHIEQAKEQIGREPYELSRLNINTEWWPYEGGECGVGPLDAVAVFEGFKNDNFCKCLLEEDIQLGKYQSHPTIKAPLSN